MFYDGLDHQKDQNQVRLGAEGHDRLDADIDIGIEAVMMFTDHCSFSFYASVWCSTVRCRKFCIFLSLLFATRHG